MRIYLIGITGCGKTTLGKELAKSLGCEFIDLDDYIIAKQGKSIEKIFEEQGEMYFRQLEQESLRKIKNKKVVVSTGGGAPCFFDNMDFMNDQGKTIWLNPDPEIVAERLINAPNVENRPMIKGKSKQDVLDFIKKKLAERQKFYSRAEVIITHNNITADMIANTLA
jgi:shikimate kinase